MRKIRVLLLTLVVAVTMMAGSLAVFAADDISGTVTSVPVTKSVDVADGITVPATNFKVYATQTDNAEDEPVAPVTGQSKTEVGSVAVAKGAKGEKVQTGAPTLNFDTLTPKAGEYTFIVTEGDENAVAAGADGWQPNSESYKVVVLVKNGENGLERQYAVYKGETKVESVDFTNTYLKTGSLTVSKKVTNPDYANLGEDEFTVKVTFTKSSTAGDATTFTAKIGDEEKTITYGTAVEIKLKHNGSVAITGIPAGTTYTALDENTGNYTYVNTDYIVNGAEADSGLVGDGTNSATVNNKFKDITITGVIMNVLPFVMMIAIAGAAAAMYVASRRRRAAR